MANVTDLLETTSVNSFRNQTTRWHTAASNQQSHIHLVKSLIAELEVHEKAGQDLNLLVPTLPMNENLLGCQGKSLTDLRGEIGVMENRLQTLRSAAAMFGWGYFEKLISLHNKELDRSEAASLAEPGPPSEVMQRMGEAAEKIGKPIGETSVTATKCLEGLASLCEGFDGLQEGQKETNTLLRELIECQKTALKEPVPPQVAAPPLMNPGFSSAAPSGGLPAAYQNAPGTPKILGADLPRPPLAPANAASQAATMPAGGGSTPTTPAPATLGTATFQTEAPQGFKRVRLATGGYLTVPSNWMPEESAV
ncbi:unnamed protein product [Durusdinium trenchii]|uniref:Uncharacterized protein n=1 Tax=Durusdinium trenchii TaxID=1381693 RepID=A0ABP0MTT1_9DINO